VNDTTAWDRRLSVESTAKNLIGHTGAVLLHRLVDRTGLAHHLTQALPTSTGNRWRDRTGHRHRLGSTQPLRRRTPGHPPHPTPGPTPSDSTLWRTLTTIDEALLAKINKARARTRRHVWNLLALRPGGFPTL